MKTTKHTPGPWAVDLTPSAINVDSDMGGICQVFGADNPDDETIPNARLIAAAPDLLSACRMALGDITQTVNYDEGDPQTLATVAAIEAAIAQATGEE